MKKFFAGLFVFIILIVYPLTLLGTIVKQVVLKPVTVKKIIHTSQVGEHLPELVAESLKDKGEEVNSAEVQAALQSSLTSEEVYAITDQAVDVIALWLGTDQRIEEMELHISTGTIKSKIAESSQGQADLSFIPDELTMQDLLAQQDGVDPAQLQQWNDQVQQARQSVRNIFLFIWIGWAVIAFSLLMILLLRHKPLHVLFGWFGWTLLFMTLECIPLALIIWLAPKWILPWISGSTSATIIEVVNNALGEAMKVFIIPLSIVMGGTLLLSIIFLLIKTILKHHHLKKTTPTQPVAPTT